MDIREFFYFQKSDRKVLLFLLVMAVVSAAIFYYAGGRQVKTLVLSEDTIMQGKRILAEIPHHGKRGDDSYGYYEVKGSKERLSCFDPNTADSNQLLSLGLAPWQVRNIYKYRARGGVYREPKDFARLYGLTVEQYRRLEPYIRIEGDYRPASVLVEDARMARKSVVAPVYRSVKIKPTEHIVLNTADTSVLKTVPGIGSGWARVIVRYGERLGGYTDTRQLLEIEGFPEDLLHYFVISNPSTRKLNLNKLTLSQLRRHPYINFYQAREICDYRRLKGPLKELDDLRLLKDFPQDKIERLAPYVEF